MESVNDQSVPAATVEFAGFRLDLRMRLLHDPDGLPVVLSSRAFSTLVFLIENQGETVSKQQLMDAVWPHSVVEENNLNQAISALRKALGDNQGKHRIILTIPGRGYCFVPTVRPVAQQAAGEEAASPLLRVRTPMPSATLWLLLIVGMAVLGIAAHKLGSSFERPAEALLTSQLDLLPEPQAGRAVPAAADGTPTALRALGVDLLPPGMAQPERVPTTSPEAYQAWLAGTAALVPGDYAEALRWFELAVASDPEFIEALVSLSMLHTLLVGVPVVDVIEHRGQALATARRALALDPSNGYAHAMLAAALHNSGQWARAEAEYDLARDFGVDVDAMEMLALLRLSVGDFSEARVVLNKTLQAEPGNLNALGFLMLVEELLGNRGAAQQLYKAGEVMYPYPAWWGDITGVWLALGRDDRDYLDKMRTEFPAYMLLQVLQVLDDRDTALARLRMIQKDSERQAPARLMNAGMFAAWYGDNALALKLLSAGLVNNWVNLYIVWLPVFDDLRSEPGFRELLQSSGIVDYWRENGWPRACQPRTGNDFECKWRAYW